MATGSHPPESMQAIGERLRLLRSYYGLTQQAFADRAGLTKTQLENYEAGRRLMKPDKAVRVIAAFPDAKLDFNWLYHNDFSGMAHGVAEAIKKLSQESAAA